MLSGRYSLLPPSSPRRGLLASWRSPFVLLMLFVTLCRAGADLKARDAFNKNALQHASEGPRKKAVAVCMKRWFGTEQPSRTVQSARRGPWR